MTNFEKIAASPETLGTFLASLPIASGPWDEAFHRTFCDGCQAEGLVDFHRWIFLLDFPQRLRQFLRRRVLLNLRLLHQPPQRIVPLRLV